MSLEPSISKRKLFGIGLCGILVCVFSLNGLLKVIANQWPGTRTNSFLLSIAGVPESLYQSLPGGPFLLFELLLRWAVLLLAAYFVLLLIASVRHQSPVIVVSGLGGLFVGLFSLTWLSLLILVLSLLRRLGAFVMELLQYVFTAILSFFLWAPIFYTILVVIGIVTITVIISVIKDVSFRDLWENLKEWLRNLSARPLFFLLGLLAVAALIWFVGIPIWEHYISPLLSLIRNWLAEYIAPILSWIWSLLLTLILGAILGALVLLALGVLGWQFMDQFVSARACGSDTHVAFRAGFGMGAAMGLILLVCAASPTFRSLVNTSWSETSPVFSSLELSTAVFYFVPASIETQLHDALAKASIPVFDLTCLILTLLIANSSLITSVLSRVTIKPLRGLIAPQSWPPLGMALFGLVIVILDSYGNDNS